MRQSRSDGIAAKEEQNFRSLKELSGGERVELSTFRLTARRSTNWANHPLIDIFVSLKNERVENNTVTYKKAMKLRNKDHCA